MLNRARKMRDDEGFTLIELLIVIVILGILSAVVVFSIQGINDRGTAAACKSDAATFTTAAEAFYAQTGAYPATAAALVPSFLHSVPTSAGLTLAFPAGLAPTAVCA